MTVPTSSGGFGAWGGNSAEMGADTTAGLLVSTGRRSGDCLWGAGVATVGAGTVFGPPGLHPIRRAVRVRTEPSRQVNLILPSFEFRAAENGVSLSDGHK